VTTSGFFSDTALRCSIDEMGIDRVLFAVDWPFVRNKPGTDWLMAAPITDSGKAMIAGENAAKLLRL
jgi:2,3-dihydroxybenzoate decarboxylase